VQLATVAIISFGTAFAFEGQPHIRWSESTVVAYFYLAIFSSGVAFTLQFWAQRRISPSTAAMIFLLEAPFGAVAGAVAYGERLTGVQMLGGLLMLVGSYLAVAFGAREPAALEPKPTALRETGL
jgi:drug/metabolite transporter (DMT)-like permease